MTGRETSTLQSFVDSTKATAQSVLGAVTGNQADKAKADQLQGEAQAKDDLSHATAKAGPFNLSASGAVTKDDPDRTTGSWNQTVGSGKEMVGNLVGSESLKRDGADQNRAGKEQEARGQLNDFAGGAADRVTGTLACIVLPDRRPGRTGTQAKAARCRQDPAERSGGRH